VALACQAQLVNTIAPIHAEPDEPARRQAIFHPFALTSRHAVGDVIHTAALGPTVQTRVHGEVPVYDGVVTRDNATGALTSFSVNRSTANPIHLVVDLTSLPETRVVEHLLLDGNKTTTGEPRPAPWEHAGREVAVLLPPVSWSMLRLATR
jgi:alpha-N-arabinofuranosidase